MTTSPETDWMNHPAIRKLVHETEELTVAERITLLKGLIPGIADELSEDDYDKLIDELRLKGRRYLEAKSHPGEGRSGRHTPGERDVEGR
jgi:hypothetical protein